MKPKSFEVQKFLEAIIELCKKSGFSLSHEDFYGSFEVVEYRKEYDEWLRNAKDKT